MGKFLDRFDTLCDRLVMTLAKHQNKNIYKKSSRDPISIGETIKYAIKMLPLFTFCLIIVCMFAAFFYYLIYYVFYGIILINNDGSALGFWGSIFGGLLTLIGVIVTIRYERNRVNNERKQKINPILLLESAAYGNTLGNITDYNSFLIMCPRLHPIGENYINLHCDMLIKNIGLYPSLETTISIHINSMKCFECRSCGVINANERDRFGIFLNINRDTIEKVFPYIYHKEDVQKVNDLIPVQLYLGEKIKHANYVAFDYGKLTLLYSDIDGNRFSTESMVKLFLINIEDVAMESNFILYIY